MFSALGARRSPWGHTVEEMRITVNGQDMDVADGLSVEGLLASLGVARAYTAVAVNRDVTPRAAFAATRLAEGDRVEIVRPIGGGAT